MSFFILLNTNEDILFGTIDFHSRKKKILWKSIVPKFNSFFKISSFVFSRRKKLKMVCNNNNFWVEYPFKPIPKAKHKKK